MRAGPPLKSALKPSSRSEKPTSVNHRLSGRVLIGHTYLNKRICQALVIGIPLASLDLQPGLDDV